MIQELDLMYVIDVFLRGMSLEESGRDRGLTLNEAEELLRFFISKKLDRVDLVPFLDLYISDWSTRDNPKEGKWHDRRIAESGL